MFTKFLFSCLLAALALSLYGQNVVRVHNDLNGTATTTNESLLTPSRVATVGALSYLGSFSCSSGLEFSQPLYASGVTIGGSKKNILILTTLDNHICLFDANVIGSSPIWNTSFGAGRASWSNNTDQFFYCSSCNIGIVGTPFLDVANGYVYVVSASATPTYTLYQLNLADGSTNASVVISGSVVGTGYSGGDNTSGANLLFKPLWSNQRPGIVLSPDASKVYVTFGGGSGTIPPPWHGWIMEYSTSGLVQGAVFCTTPNGWGGSLWMSGGGPVFDGSGNLYVVSGSEGDWDGVTDFSDTILKLSPTLTLLDWMTPSNHVTNDANDYDFGSNWARLISDNSGNTYAVAGGKDFQVYSVLTTCMGHLQGSGFGGCSIQQFQTNAASTTKFSGSYGGVFMNNVLFLPITAGDIYAFTWNPSTGLFTTAPLWHQTNTYGFPGPAPMSGSCSGSTGCILWTVTTTTNTFTSLGVGIVRAINPANGSELWNSGSLTFDISKFAAPTVANGHVFVSTQSGFTAAFGLVPSSAATGLVTINGQITIQ